MAKTTLRMGHTDTNVDDFISGAPLQEKKPVQKERKNKVISITLRQSDLDIMDNFCAETGMSRSNLVRLAVKSYVNKNNI